MILMVASTFCNLLNYILFIRLAFENVDSNGSFGQYLDICKVVLTGSYFILYMLYPLFNLNNWIQMYFKIKQQICLNDQHICLCNKKIKIKRIKLIINIITIVLSLLCITITIALKYKEYLYKYKHIDKQKADYYRHWLYRISGSGSFIIGIGFAITNYQCKKLIQNNFTSFYNNNQNMLMLANVGLSLPYVLKGIL